jgi:hypothetical protein
MRRTSLPAGNFIFNHKMKETNHDVGVTDQDVPSTSSSSSSNSSNSSKIQKKSPVAVVSSLMLEKDHCNDAPHECSSVAACIDEKKKEPKVNATRWRPPTPPPPPPSSSSSARSSSPSTMKQGDAFHDGPDNYKTKWFHVQLPFLFSKQKKQQLDQQHNDGFSMLADDSLVLSSNQSTSNEERNNINYNRRYDSKDDPEDPQPGRQPQGQELDYEKHLLEPSGDEINSYSNSSRSTGTSRRKKLPNSIHNFFGRRSHSKHEIHHDHFIQYYGNRNDHFLDNDIVCNNKDQDLNDDEREQQSSRSCSNYQMMKSQHGPSSSSSSSSWSRRFLQQERMVPESTTSLPLEEETCFFYSGMDQLEHEKKRQIMTSHVAASPYSSNDDASVVLVFVLLYSSNKEKICRGTCIAQSTP